MKSSSSSLMRQIMSKTSSAAREQVCIWLVILHTFGEYCRDCVVIQCFYVMQTSVTTLWKFPMTNFDLSPWLLHLLSWHGDAGCCNVFSCHLLPVYVMAVVGRCIQILLYKKKSKSFDHGEFEVHLTTLFLSVISPHLFIYCKLLYIPLFLIWRLSSFFQIQYLITWGWTTHFSFKTFL